MEYHNNDRLHTYNMIAHIYFIRVNTSAKITTATGHILKISLVKNLLVWHKQRHIVTKLERICNSKANSCFYVCAEVYTVEFLEWYFVVKYLILIDRAYFVHHVIQSPKWWGRIHKIDKEKSSSWTIASSEFFFILQQKREEINRISTRVWLVC